MKMSIYDAPSDEYNEKLAEALKKIPAFEMPEWAGFVKTGVSRMRPPEEDDWWYKRAASILRQIYIHNVVGVGRLRTRYGSKKNRGMKPEKFKKASGKIIRVILQQCESAGFLEKTQEKRAGRKLSEYGRKFLDDIAGEILKTQKEVKVEEEIKEKKIEKAEKKGEELINDEVIIKGDGEKEELVENEDKSGGVENEP